VVCKHCGHPNPDENFFCGQCGSPLLRSTHVSATAAPQPGPQRPGAPANANSAFAQAEPRRLSKAPLQPLRPEPQPSETTLESPNQAAQREVTPTPIGEATRKDSPAERNAPSLRSEEVSRWTSTDAEAGGPTRTVPEGIPISGPSFLGLANGSAEDSSLDYLYDDEPQRGHSRLIIVLLLIIAVGVFLAYEWKQLPNWYGRIVQPIEQRIRPNPDPPKPNATSESTAPSDLASQPTQPLPAGTPATAPAHDPPATSGDPANGASGERQNSTAEAGASPTTRAANGTQIFPGAEKAMPQPDAGNVRDGASAGITTRAGVPAPQPTSVTREKPSAPARPAASESDTLYARGEAYLSGSGVPKSCTNALIYLDRAARIGNPKAASQLGGLYATGHCVNLDRARAYPYFTEAQNAAHGHNPYVQHNREMIWSQMTPAEKARAQATP
jgi:hypothetical protein